MGPVTSSDDTGLLLRTTSLDLLHPSVHSSARKGDPPRTCCAGGHGPPSAMRSAARKVAFFLTLTPRLRNKPPALAPLTTELPAGPWTEDAGRKGSKPAAAVGV
ncbi:hypothetical protein CB1_001107058 [Camelus ferus]|nr:hypothetical protein CB1_001107058 [Camelus ferus]